MRYRLIISLLILSSILLLSTPPSHAQEGPSQAAINTLLANLETDYGITAAFPAEWQAQTAGEVIQLYDYLTMITLSCELTAQELWTLNNKPANFTPAEHFRLHFDAANLQIDRTGSLGAGFAGNTAPRHEGGEIVGYMIQLTPLGVSQPFTFAHELGHVMDAMLNDIPHNQHVADLGGLVGSVGWIPGEGFIGNENLFPRANGGANEDFADTFGQMMVGNLSPDNSTAPRYHFMVAHTAQWLTIMRLRDLLPR